MMKFAPKRTKPKSFVASADLLQEAAEAAPIKLRGKWGKHWELFEVLMTNGRGHDCKSAVEWLVGKGLVEQKDFDAAYLALRCRWNRRCKKGASVPENRGEAA